MLSIISVHPTEEVRRYVREAVKSNPNSKILTVVPYKTEIRSPEEVVSSFGAISQGTLQQFAPTSEILMVGGEPRVAYAEAFHDVMRYLTQHSERVTVRIPLSGVYAYGDELEYRALADLVRLRGQDLVLEEYLKDIILAGKIASASSHVSFRLFNEEPFVFGDGKPRSIDVVVTE